MVWLMCFLISCQLCSTVFCVILLKKCVMKADVFSRIFPQSALLKRLTFRFSFLANFGLMSLSTNTMSWFEIPGMTLINLVRLGLLVQYRSSTLHSLVASFCSWVRWWSLSSVISFSGIVTWSALGLTEFASQSICPALKSPPRMMVEFELFFNLPAIW